MRVANLTLVTIVLGLFSPMAFASPKELKVKSSSNVIPQLIEVKVTYGEKITEFRIETTQGKSHLALNSNQGNTRKREIKIKDAAYIASKLRSVPATLSASGQCSRRWIQATMSTNRKIEYEASACLVETSPIGRNLLDVANLLSVAN